MKLGFLSDIHSNIHAFQTILEYGEKLGIDEWFCCGDIVGYNAFPRECIALLQKKHIQSVLGNHDWATVTGDTSGFNPYGVAGVQYSRKKLGKQELLFLKNLPQQMNFEKDDISFFLVHGSPRDPLSEYVYPESSESVLKSFAEVIDTDIIVIGHTHVPMQRQIKDTLFLNPGSVGQPRDGNCNASFLMYNTMEKKYFLYRVVYDVQAAADANKKNELPDFLAERLFLGR